MRRYWWENLSDNQLMKTPLRQLNLCLKGSGIEAFMRKLERELRARGVHYQPYYWISDDWFCPEGSGGVAVPFYLTHPRLLNLERKQVGRAEGSRPIELMKILRHEVGHALEHVYQLSQRPERVRVFGDTRKAYPTSYLPIKYSRSYVKNLPDNYAQSHPDEDFAETFAVWLTPKTQWKKRYQYWPALNKLQTMNSIMNCVAQAPVPRIKKKTMDELSSLDITLNQYFQKKKRRLKIKADNEVDRELLQVFPSDKSKIRLDKFLKNNNRIKTTIAEELAQPKYMVEPIINKISIRSKKLNIYFEGEEEKIRDFLLEKSLDYFFENRHKIYM